MATLLQRIGALLPSRKSAGVRLFRQFEAARVDRLTASWRGTDATIDQELRSDLRNLRRRSRQLSRDNEYLKRFLKMCSANIIGQGMTLQSRPVDYGPNGPVVDGLAAQIIERHWYTWCKAANCDVTGRSGFWLQMRMAAEICARDGEVLMRIRYPKGSNKYGIALEHIDIERLDWQMNVERQGNTNAIKMGVEVDQYGKPVAYHILDSAPSNGTPAGKTERVLADDIIHAWLPTDAGQSRGYPWAHAAMRRLNDLQGYREAAVIAARIGASKMGFYTTEQPDILTDGSDGEVPFTSAEPGEFGVLPPGTNFQTYDPTYPHDQFPEFVKATLRGISSALGVSYNTLANDLEGVNYSSIRAGVLEEREQWMMLQDWWIEQVVDRIFAAWLNMALLNQVLTYSGSGLSLPFGKYEKFLEHEFMGRRWSWVDPLKDVQANLMAIEAGLTTVTDVAAKNGVDIEDVLATKQRENQLMQQYGVTLGTHMTGAQAQPANEPDGDEADVQAQARFARWMELARGF